MRTSVVDVFLHYPAQMKVAKQNEEVETLSPQTAPEPLTDAIGLRSIVGGGQQYKDAVETSHG
jgi:hypothetical protein